MSDSSAFVLRCCSTDCLYLEEGQTPASIQYFSTVLCAREAISLVSVHGISNQFKWTKKLYKFLRFYQLFHSTTYYCPLCEQFTYQHDKTLSSLENKWERKKTLGGVTHTFILKKAFCESHLVILLQPEKRVSILKKRKA